MVNPWEFIILHSIFQRPKWRRPSGARVIVCALAVLALGYGAATGITTFKYDPKNTESPCQFRRDSKVVQAMSFARIAVDSIIPFLVVLTTNVILIRNVLKSQENLISMNESTPGSSSTPCSKTPTLDQTTAKMDTTKQNPAMTDRRMTKAMRDYIAKRRAQRQLAIMVICTSIAFICLTLPFPSMLPIGMFYNYRKSLTTFVNFRIARKCTNLLLAANASINVFVYLASGTKFRQDFKTLFVGMF